MRKEKYFVTGMTCSACSARVQKAVEKLPGQHNAAVNLLTNTMQLEYDERQLSSGEIIAAVEKAGYGAVLAGDGIGAAPQTGLRQEQPEDVLAREAAAMYRRLLWSVVFLLPLMYIAMHAMLEAWLGLPVSEGVRALLDGRENAVSFAFVQLLLVCPILLLNRRYFISGFRNLLHGAPNMDSLVGIGSAASLVFGIFAIFRMSWGLGHGDWLLVEEYSRNLYFESAGMIVTLITAGKYLEAKAKNSTGTALQKLMQLLPQTALVVRNGQETELPVEELRTGDEVIVKPGGVIAADGIILSGSAAVDESAVTGESIPAAKNPGDKVISASLNLDGYIHFRAVKVGAESTISQIIKLVDEAGSSKAPIARTADRIAGIFVPAVIALAAVTAAGWLMLGAGAEFAFSAAISVLVISCPCALGLATPVAIMVGTGRGAERGILIKSGEALERAKHIDTIVLDKTGTITRGRPEITDVLCIHDSERDLLEKIVSLEKASQHPLAQAVIAYGQKKNIVSQPVDGFINEPGRGISGMVKGERIFAGNAEYIKEQGIALEGQEEKIHLLSDMGKTVLLAADTQRLLGILAAADTEKPSSRQAVEELQGQGLEVIMLTGDNRRTAQAVAKRLGIARVLAQVMPQDKEQAVRELQAQGKTVAMVGDGINDAPALARADVGIAIGAGADIALESADVVLVGSSLEKVADTIRLSRAVIRNIRENLFWAFFYNVIGIPLAAGLLYPAFGLKLSPMIGAAAMSMSSLCVVLNALRLKRFSFRRGKTAPAAAGQDAAECGTGKDEDVMKTELRIEGMMCMHCQKHVQDALSRLAGVVSVEVSLENKTASVEAVREIPRQEFETAITEAGYELL